MRWQKAAAKQKGEVIDEMAATFGWSRNKCYRTLAALGFTSGRKKRSDAGKSSMDEETLRMVAAMNREGLRKNGKATMHTPNAASILQTNGIAVPVSNRQVNRLLKEKQLNAQTLRRPKPHGRMRSLHPNHVWQIDPSLCLMYYDKKKGQTLIEEEELHRNKPAFIEKMRDCRLWRYVCTDHFSGMTYVYYYKVRGEDQATGYDFFLRCATKKENNPFHGVPKILLWDKGSANISKAMVAALGSLGVRTITHRRGAPQVKGSVENGNRRVETVFESRIKYEAVPSVEELNDGVEAFFIAYNANLVPYYDSRLKRIGAYCARAKIWRSIKTEELRLLPDITVCRRLLVQSAEDRVVGDDRCISLSRHVFNGAGGCYPLGTIEVVAGQKVQVQCLAYEGAAILVHYQDFSGAQQTVHIAEPLPVDERSGFIATAPVIGEEFRSVGDDKPEIERKRLEQAAHPQGKNANSIPFGHLNDGRGLVAHSHLAEIVREAGRDSVNPKGKTIRLFPTSIYPKEYSLVEGLTLLKSKLEQNGYEYRKEYVGLVQGCMKGGKIAEHSLEGIYQEITEDKDVVYLKEA